MMLLINRDDTIQWRYGFLQWLVGMMYWFEESENILADDPIVQYVHICALNKTVHRIGSHIVHKWEWYDLLSFIVHYVRICVSNGITDGIAYCTSPFMSRLHIIPFGYVHSLFNTVKNPSSLFPIPHAMIFSQSSMCASTFSKHIINDFWLNHYSTFSFSG